MRIKSIIIFLLVFLWGCDDSVTIKAPQCGNGEIESFEECDDGNIQSNDGCSNFCKIELTEDCFNGNDDDSDGLIDCSDPDCFGGENCTGEICRNGIDDDNNGLIDCDDPHCFSLNECLSDEDCTNKIDDDNNGLIDCDDSVCINHPGCGSCDPDETFSSIIPQSQVTPQLNSFENIVSTPCGSDTDSYWVSRVIITSPVSITMDSSTLLESNFIVTIFKEEEPNQTCELDFFTCVNLNEGSSPKLYHPLLPPGTYRFYFSNPNNNTINISFSDPVFENCSNNMDDDGNGLVDCEDPVCLSEINCLIENCFNGIDDTQNSLVDCEDPSCAVECAPIENCSNEIDDDLDGATDCKDPDCAGSSECQGSSCISYSWLGDLNRGSYITTPFDTTTTDNSYSSSCGGWGPDYTHSFNLLSSANILIHMTQQGSHSLSLATEAGEGSLCNSGELYCIESAGLHLPLTATFLSLPPAKYFLLIDSKSSDASGFGELEINVTGSDSELCINSLDDDGDGNIDCDDSECSSLSICAGETLCHDNIDNDSDGWQDCQDPNCIDDQACSTNNCSVDKHLGTLMEGSPLSTMVNLSGNTNSIELPCGSGQMTNSAVISFNMAQEGRLRVRTIPQGFSEPVTAVAFQGGQLSTCGDAIHICSSVPAPGIANTMITPLTLKAGGPYFILVSPYMAQDTGTAQIILYIEP
jgi:cysteine-rich repeat protein